MTCECWEPSFSNLLRMEASGASQSVCAAAAQASADASANKAASFASIRMFRGLLSRRILLEDASNMLFVRQGELHQCHNAYQSEGLRHLGGRIPNKEAGGCG